MGYHRAEIRKGVIGRLSKVQEELDEALDAEAQGDRIMLLVELSDMIGALEAYLEAEYVDFSLEDLISFSDKTRSAFHDGTRKAR